MPNHRCVDYCMGRMKIRHSYGYDRLRMNIRHGHTHTVWAAPMYSMYSKHFIISAVALTGCLLLAPQ
jgi:hypothetical protein